MKKWISYILLSALLITALPPFAAKAAEKDCTGKLAASGNNINVELAMPHALADDITSLHFRVNVSITNGKMEAPVFQFSDTVQSEVKDNSVISSGTDKSSYIIDVILSGKENQVIFPESGQAAIGTISLKPSSDVYKISSNFTGITSGSTEPVVEYVTAKGQVTQEATLVNTEVITIEKKAGQNQSVISSSSYIPSSTKEPDASATPSPVPDATDTPDVSTSVSPAPGNTATPDASANVTKEPGSTQEPVTTAAPGSFDTQPKPSLSVSSRKGSRIVTFKWNVTDGADGYIIYSSGSKSGNYKRTRTILKPDRTSCNVKMDYASSYLFRMRAFKTSEDGSRIFGQYSSVKKLTTSPAKVKGLKARLSGNKTSLSWKKVKNADGYQVYAGKKKNGSYSLVKTIKKGSVLKATVKKGKKTSYFKIRAYVNNANKKRVYGNFCTTIKAK